MILPKSQRNPQGDATEAHVLAPYKFMSGGTFVQKVGNITDHTGMSPQKVDYQPGIPTEVRITVPEGFYKANNPAYPLFVYEPNLTEDKIPVNVSIFGVDGSYTSDADATADDIRAGKTAYVNGVKITGTANF